MDPILQILLSFPFVIFCLGIAAVVFVFRTFIEYLMTVSKLVAKEYKFWNDFFLPVSPVVIGSIIGFYFKSYPYPNGLTTDGDRIMFGLVAGLFSTLTYRVVKALLFQKIQEVLPTDQSGSTIDKVDNIK